MKFLAIEHSMPEANANLMNGLLAEEARKTWELRQSGLIREIYFNETHDAVIVLEAKDRAAAEEVIGSLPLVQAGQIRFEVMELRPYDGWSRLFSAQEQVPFMTS